MTPATYRNRREKLNLTQRQLAALVGVSRATINRRERGHEAIDAEAALAIRALKPKTKTK